MKKIILIVTLFSLFGCNKKIEPPENVILINKGLPNIKADEYYTCTVRCTTYIGTSTKIVTSQESFNIAEYQSGSLELKTHQVCVYYNNNMDKVKTIPCNEYSFYNVVINNCK